MTEHLIAPHGGELIQLIVPPERASELQEASRDWPSWDLTARQVCDLELLMNGGFSPLSGFMTSTDYGSVCESMRLADGTLWPIPITLDVDEACAEGLESGSTVALRDAEGVMLAALHVEEIWRPDRVQEAEQVYGTANPEHPGAAYRLEQSNPVYLGAASRVSKARATTISARFAALRWSSVTTLHGWDGGGSSRSRPETPCTVPIRS